MFSRKLAMFLAVLLFSGCAGLNKTKFVQGHDPIMDQDGGVVLFVDVCNQMDTVGNDYFVVNESKKVSKAMVKGVTTYLEKNGVKVRSEITPFVCGALDTKENPPVKVAEKIGGAIKESKKPFGVIDEVAQDTEYLDALTTLATSIHGKEMYDIATYYNKNKKGKKVSQFILDEDKLKAASGVVKAKTGAASILYVGVNGTKVSGGKKFAQGLGCFTVGMATGLATGGAVSFIPGHRIDGKYFFAGLVNLESGKLVWDGWSHVAGNPLSPKAVVIPSHIDLLLKKLVFKEVPR